MKLIGIEIRNFRSIGEQSVTIYPMEKCNILIGKNNVGKSNVIRAFQWITEYFQKINNNSKPSGYDRHQKVDDKLFGCRLTFRLKLDNPIAQATKLTDFYFDFSEKLGVGGIHLFDSTFAHIEENRSLIKVSKLMNYNVTNTYNIQEWFSKNVVQEIFNRFRGSIPTTEFIPQFRQIQEGDEYDFKGRNLIKELEKYQNPQIGDEHHFEKFEKINTLVQNLLHLPDAKIDIPQGGKEIAITNDGLRLPLDAYGTGVHELIILATAILSIENHNTICCIEEPEIHLHPALQREFIQFITEQTDISYLISTHSPTLINVQATMPPETQHKVQVFHLILENNSTVGGAVLEDSHALYALNDLGVKASDILQSNCVIWVEGPSDRIYLNCWINLIAPHLIEGLHYSIMFYGGRLLSHLGIRRDNHEKVPDELIDLLKINQRAIVVIDSDRDKKGKRINDTKIRIRQECEDTESHCWITDGREIENYLSEELISVIFSDLVNKQIKLTFDTYEKLENALENALKRAKARNIKYADDKVKYSRLIAESYTEEYLTDDLKKQLATVIDKIELWNQ